jgi:hypothetical protein
LIAAGSRPGPIPPGAGEITIRIGTRGAQYVDALMLARKYQFRPEPPSSQACEYGPTTL